MTASPVAIHSPGHGCMDDLTTECSFDLQTRWVTDVLGMLSMGVCTTMHWPMSSRLVQEFNVCTLSPRSIVDRIHPGLTFTMFGRQIDTC